ncbi:hypothetical protein E2P81_ATG06061 [Venturia nashicola]|uniref:Uncharacterized protein n=1 Tax=Venturia nashicola TaxID=86259 RepID=A0A4Z1PD74_9PEZI|nr:hypothetical protein E6O75_ATG06204 [Venturia nashicola]TLD29767.1 hypothetical protein E2P81_ATG06061 [Venturia nashicola]
MATLYPSPDGSCGQGTFFTCKKSGCGGCRGKDNKCSPISDACASGCQSELGYCLSANYSAPLHHPTHGGVIRLTPARREEETKSTHLATIGGPNHLTFAPHAGSTATLSDSGVMTIQTISVYNDSTTRLTGSHVMTSETISVSDYPDLAPVEPTRTLSPVNTIPHHNGGQVAPPSPPRRERQATTTLPAGIPNPLDPICSSVCRPFFQECMKVCPSRFIYD